MAHLWQSCSSGTGVTWELLEEDRLEGGWGDHGSPCFGWSCIVTGAAPEHLSPSAKPLGNAQDNFMDSGGQCLAESV